MPTTRVWTRRRHHFPPSSVQHADRPSPRRCRWTRGPSKRSGSPTCLNAVRSAAGCRGSTRRTTCSEHRVRLRSTCAQGGPVDRGSPKGRLTPILLGHDDARATAGGVRPPSAFPAKKAHPSRASSRPGLALSCRSWLHPLTSSGDRERRRFTVGQVAWRLGVGMTTRVTIGRAVLLGIAYILPTVDAIILRSRNRGSGSRVAPSRSAEIGGRRSGPDARPPPPTIHSPEPPSRSDSRRLLPSYGRTAPRSA